MSREASRQRWAEFARLGQLECAVRITGNLGGPAPLAIPPLPPEVAEQCRQAAELLRRAAKGLRVELRLQKGGEDG